MRNIFTFCVIVLIPFIAAAQSHSPTIRGKVTDQSGLALADVTVRSNSKGNQTSTDRDGLFAVTITDLDTLIVTRIGYESIRLAVSANRAEIIIRMVATDRHIEEVVIHTGYQSLKPNEVNGSVTVIDNKLLNLQIGTNILQRLDGVTNGLTFNIGRRNTNPQNNTNIMVRGHSTINGPLDPLIVLDNFVYEGDIANINPDDVETVTILKDAAATSIYGARGGNGVIVITTKKGQYNQPVSVEVRVSNAITAIPDLSPLQGMSNSDFIDVERMLYDRGQFSSIINASARTALTPVVDVLNRRDKGVITFEEAESLIQQYEDGNLLDQYKRSFYKKGITQQYHLGVRGGSEKHNWMLSSNLNKGVSTTENRRDRLNLRLSNTLKVAEWVSMGVDAHLNDTKITEGEIPSISNLTQFGSRAVPYTLLYDQMGDEIPIARYNSMYLDTVGKGRLLDWKYYPLQDRKLTKQYDNVQEIIGAFNIQVHPIEAFRLEASYQYQKQQTDGQTFFDRDSYAMRDFINKYAQINESTGVINYPVPLADRQNNRSQSVNSQQLRIQTNFAKQWLDHRINALVGFEARETTSSGGSYWLYGYNEDPLSVAVVNHTDRFSLRPSGSSTIPGANTASPTIRNRFVSIYGNAFYSFRDRYSLSASARRDGSNLYGVTTNDKWKPLWSMGVGYEISKEPFFKSEFIDYLKLRSTVGYSGNVDLRRSAVAVIGFMNGPAELGSPRIARIDALNNPSLRWEQVKQINFGADFRVWDNRVEGSLEYYIKEASDLYGPAPFDYTTYGARSTIVMNAADLSGKGVDVQLRITPLRNLIVWNSSFIVNYNSNKTKRYHLATSVGQSDIEHILSANGALITPVEGKPLYAIAALRWGGLNAEGNPQGYLDGQLSTDYVKIREEVRQFGVEKGSAVYVGSAVPVHFGSWLNEVRFRGFALSWNITYRAGYFFRRSSIIYEALVNRGQGHKDFANRWQQPGDELHTDVPSFIFPEVVPSRDDIYANSEVLVEKSDHIRLQFMNFSYELLSKKKYLPKRTNFFINVSDLGILWRANKHGLDPDYPYTIRPSGTFSLGFSSNF